MNELLIQSGAIGAVVAVALGLMKLLEKTWDKRNGRSNGLGTVLSKLESSLDSTTHFHNELVQHLREVREDQERIKNTLTKLESDSKYLRSWHEKTEDGRIAAYYPHEQTRQQHQESMVVLRNIASAVERIPAD